MSVSTTESTALIAQTVVQIDAKSDERTAVRKDEVIAEQNAAKIALIGAKTAEQSGERFAQTSAMIDAQSGVRIAVSNAGRIDAMIAERSDVSFVRINAVIAAMKDAKTDVLNAASPTGSRTVKSGEIHTGTAIAMRAGAIIDTVVFAIISRVGSIDHGHATTSHSIAVHISRV